MLLCISFYLKLFVALSPQRGQSRLLVSCQLCTKPPNSLLECSFLFLAKKKSRDIGRFDIRPSGPCSLVPYLCLRVGTPRKAVHST